MFPFANPTLQREKADMPRSASLQPSMCQVSHPLAGVFLAGGRSPDPISSPGGCLRMLPAQEAARRRWYSSRLLVRVFTIYRVGVLILRYSQLHSPTSRVVAVGLYIRVIASARAQQEQVAGHRQSLLHTMCALLLRVTLVFTL